ncbi:MAG: VRR-NUC domain-containing protein [Clostridia bacterium]|nr:VRR-NUC domain-containing protein [Clostridia bacterium]
MPTPEGKIEDYFLKKCKENGILCWKFTSASQNGVPDRILIYDGQVVFVELKAPGETPRPDQLAIHRMIRRHRAVVLVSDDNRTSDEIIDRLLDHEFIPKKPRKKKPKA